MVVGSVTNLRQRFLLFAPRSTKGSLLFKKVLVVSCFIYQDSARCAKKVSLGSSHADIAIRTDVSFTSALFHKRISDYK